MTSEWIAGEQVAMVIASTRQDEQWRAAALSAALPLQWAMAAGQWYGQAIDASMGGWLAPRDILRRSSERLQQLLQFARRHVPLYRDLLGADRHAPLSGWPVISKATLVRELGRSLADRRLNCERIAAFLQNAPVGGLLDGRYAVWTSSGSTGPPAVFVQDRNALAIYEALELFRARGLASPGQWATRVAAGERYAMVAATGGHFAGVATIESIRQRYPWMASSVRAISLLQPLQQLTAELNQYQPVLLATYPTAADLLAEEQAAGRLALKLRELWLGGETLTDAVRQRLQRVFGCRVRQSYGASECMSLAFECEAQRLHLNADWAILEPVDAQQRPVEPGIASASVLLTNLANRAQPLIRYDLGDSILVEPEPCACGCALPAIRVEGRSDDVLQVPAAHGGGEVRLLPLVLETVLEDHAQLDHYQLVQTARSKLLLRTPVAPARAQRAVHLLREFLRVQGAGRVQIAVAAEAPRAGSGGKLRRVMRADRPNPSRH